MVARPRRRRRRPRRAAVLRPARRRRRPPRRPGDTRPGAGAAGSGPARPRRPGLADLRAGVPHPARSTACCWPSSRCCGVCPTGPSWPAPASPSSPRRPWRPCSTATTCGWATNPRPTATCSTGSACSGRLLWTGGYPLVGWIGFVLVGLWLARRRLGDRVVQVRLLVAGAAIALATAGAGVGLRGARRRDDDDHRRGAGELPRRSGPQQPHGLVPARDGDGHGGAGRRAPGDVRAGPALAVAVRLPRAARAHRLPRPPGARSAVRVAVDRPLRAERFRRRWRSRWRSSPPSWRWPRRGGRGSGGARSRPCSERSAASAGRLDVLDEEAGAEDRGLPAVAAADRDAAGRRAATPRPSGSSARRTRA